MKKMVFGILVSLIPLSTVHAQSTGNSQDTINSQPLPSSNNTQRTPATNQSTSTTSYRSTTNQPLPFAYQVVLEPYQNTSFSTEVNTKVIKINKKMGETFKKGEVLMLLDTVILEALLQKALAAQEKAKTIYESTQTLFDQNSASRDELVEAKSALSIANAEAIIAQKNLDNAKIIAPYDGRVAYVNVEEEEYPNRQYNYKDKPMMEVVNDRTLLAKVLIPSTLLNKVSRGQKLSLKIKETGETTVATIKRISSLIDPASSTVLIEGEIDNPDGRLMGGMTGIATLESQGNQKPPK